MMKLKLLLAVGMTAATAPALGASAYTAGFASIPASKVIGYGSTTITGATMASAPTYTYSTDHSQITAINVSLVGDTTTSTLSTVENTNAPVTCAGAGDFSGGVNTNYICSGLTISVNGLTKIGFVIN